MFWEVIKIALDSLMGNRFRTLLTILSVTIGSFSIVVMMSLAESGSATLGRSIEEIGGAKLVWWVPETPTDTRQLSLYDDGFTPEDIRALSRLPFIRRVTAQLPLEQQVAYATQDNTLKLDLVGTLDGLLQGLTWNMAQGRTFRDEEVANYERVAILTDGVAKTLFKGESPIGKSVNLLGKPYTVVGVLAKREMLMRVQIGFDWDNTIFVPLQTLEKREGKDIRYLMVIAFTTDDAKNKVVEGLGNATLLARHNGVADFKSINFGEMVGQFNQFFSIVTLIVGLIAAISLFAGGIGVMNIMLVSVTERVREIGIRKALGASIGSILLQFLGEATVLSTVGGLIGVGLGVGVTFVAHIGLAQWSQFWEAHYSMLGIGLALGVTGFIGLFFGAVPAWQAARLDIIECLRR